jgi:hypothetical protein
MKSASLKASGTQSISKITSLHCEVESANRCENDEDCYLHNLSSTRSFESGTTRTASLTDNEGTSTWETHSTDSSFTSPFQEATADVTRKSQLQVQFAEQTAEEMAQVMNYWSKYDDSYKTPKKTQSSDGDHQRACLPTNSLILYDEEEEVEEISSLLETESRMNTVPDLICATPGSAMSHMTAMTPRTPGPVTPQHFDFMGADSTPVPRSPAIPEDPFSPLTTTTSSAEELHWIARDQKSKVDSICWVTRIMAESLAEVTDISDDEDESEVHKLPLLPPLPELTWRDNLVVQLKWQTQLLGDFIFLCILHMLPLEWLSVCMWLRFKTSARTKSLLVWLVCGLLAASLLALERSTKYSLPTTLVCWERFVVLDPSPYQYHDYTYTIDEPNHLYATSYIPEHGHAFLL